MAVLCERIMSSQLQFRNNKLITSLFNMATVCEMSKPWEYTKPDITFCCKKMRVLLFVKKTMLNLDWATLKHGQM